MQSFYHKYLVEAVDILDTKFSFVSVFVFEVTALYLSYYNSLSMAELKAKFSQLTSMKYIDQAKWYLNGFWTEGAEQEAENIWKYTQKFIELDSRQKEGNELDEFWSHKFLESLGETLTVVKLREKLRQIDMDVNGKMALLEYLLFRYEKTVQACVVAPQVPFFFNLFHFFLHFIQLRLFFMMTLDRETTVMQ